MKQFCCYIHSRPNGAAFYVGKASDLKRPYSMRRNEYHGRVVAKYGKKNIKVTVHRCQTEAEAIEMEVATILAIRLNGGQLTNHTDGGEGNSGWTPSEETKRKIGKANKGKPSPRKGAHLSDATKEKLRLSRIGKKGPVHGEEAKAKIRAAQVNRVVTEELREKLRIARKKQGPPSEATKAKTSATMKRRRKENPELWSRYYEPKRQTATTEAM